MSTTANSMATARVTDLPATIEVEVNGSTLIAEAKASGAGNIWYENVQEFELADGANLVDALLASVVKFDGVELGVGKRNRAGDDKVIAYSEPSKYGKDHATKAGQTIPNTGGKPTISFVSFDAPFDSWGDKGYMLRVTLQGSSDGVKRSGKVTVACQGAIGGGSTRIVGTKSAPIVLG